ncbi:TOMM precursor leader peptide-binding protein [Solirubrobacter phytolaccae]|uniref:TOMM leader peptide-binding protein n=1 Tax=Solirubrobacter phytolaccae TaxID=1404360 RepID=A0A9X3NM76_9ACTN|nr:TOMM precursor leader peptide-binding protein [Solirubrobacter phytolaccae]MDA0183987.1 TOMM precursor leader peptide-binding protein [Solirubrobacter phytolaccae]
MQRLLLPSHVSVWFDPPDEDGDEALHIVSERRSLTLKGLGFRELCERVVPLLDGTRSLDDIQAQASDVIDAEDLAETLDLLLAQGVVVEAPDEPGPERRLPQRNLFSDLAPGEDLQRRLATATVTVIGLGGAGPAAVLALAAAGVGTLRCHDALAVTPADTYFSPFLGVEAVGASRAQRVAAQARAAAPDCEVLALDTPLEDDEDVRRAIAGSDYVLCCLDAGQLNLAYKVNRACLALHVRWIACALSGAEVIVGPAIDPGRSACFMCYRMRAVACAGNPEHAFVHERRLDRRRSDDSDRRENLVFGAGIAANLAGNEVLNDLSGLAAPALVGRILTIRLTDLAIERHAVLRKPDCPACHDR